MLAWHDCTIGVTWDTLESMAEDYFPLDDTTGKLVQEFLSGNGINSGVAADLIGERFTAIDRKRKRFVREHRD